jgi:ATP-dependent DNA ligase
VGRAQRCPLDGYWALCPAGRLVSRNGTNLNPLFPGIGPVLAAPVTPDLILDGRLVTWSASAGRLDFGVMTLR